MKVLADIVNYDGNNLTLIPYEKLDRVLEQLKAKSVEIRIVDGRTISPPQRKKIYSLLRDISSWSGYSITEIKELLKVNYCLDKEIDIFSLSDCEKSTAKGFITYLINFCMDNDIGTKNSLLDLNDDIGSYLYTCLENRKCAICNQHGEVHHVDRVGMGRDRTQISHIGMKAICLCRYHHTLVHNDEKKIFEKYHVYGIKLDEYLCKKLKLNIKE